MKNELDTAHRNRQLVEDKNKLLKKKRH